MPRKGVTTPAGDPLRRGLRSLAQVAFVQGCVQLYNAFAAIDITAEQLAAITVVATPLLAFAQNWLEDNTTLPAVLKSPPSTGQNPT